MDLSDAPVIDLRPTLSHERQDLLSLLTGLSPEEWATSSAVPGWSVRDLVLHLLDDDFGWLSRGRDGDLRSLVPMDDHEFSVAGLAAKNQRWIDGAQGLSSRVITELLAWSGDQMDAFYASMDLAGEGHVSWASDGPIPIWFDIAQDLTERRVHQMQAREAIDRVDGYAQRYLPAVLRTFVWALPHQYRVDAPTGTAVQVDLAAGGTWHLVSDGAGRWSLDEGTLVDSEARAEFTSDAAWRWLTGAGVPSGGSATSGSRVAVPTPARRARHHRVSVLSAP